MYYMCMDNFITTTELAKILGISRIAIFNRIKEGKINAKKEGKRYLIDKSEIPALLGKEVSLDQKKEIDSVVEKVVKEYGTTLKLLAKE